MFSRIKKWLAGAPEPTATPSASGGSERTNPPSSTGGGVDTANAIYSPAQRFIFHYFDGEKVVRVDPIEQYRKYSKVKDEIEVARSVAASPSKDREQQYEVMISRIRELFSIPKLGEHSGLTEQESVDLFNHFLEYCDYVKKNTRT